MRFVQPTCALYRLDDGKKMTLTVTLTDANQQIGTFTLVRRHEGRLHKCL